MYTYVKMTKVISILIIFSSPFGINGIECPTEDNLKCQEFWFQIFSDMGSNLEEAIKCLPSPTLPIEVSFFVPELKFIKVDDFHQVKIKVLCFKIPIIKTKNITVNVTRFYQYNLI